MKTFPIILSLALAMATPTFSASFTNLDFESAVVQINEPNFGMLDWALAVPGWNHSSGDGTEIVYYGFPHIGTTQIYLLLDTNTLPYGSLTPLAGDYSLAFASGNASGFEGTGWTSAFISQTGDIPANTRSLQFLATGPFAVFLGGVSIPMLALGGNNYAGDIASFAETTTELTIMNVAPYGSIHTHTVVDNIVFSPILVPEPTILAMLTAALASILTITHCGGRKKYGQIMPCHPSPFLKELPPELVETDAEKSKKPVEVSTGGNLLAAMREATQ